MEKKMNRFKQIWIQLDPDEQNGIKAEVLDQIKNNPLDQEARIRLIKKLVFLKK